MVSAAASTVAQSLRRAEVYLDAGSAVASRRHDFADFACGGVLARGGQGERGGVLLQLADFWWDHDRKPFPAKKLLAERMGMDPRNVQKHIADLETAGYVRRISRHRTHGGQTSNTYDLSGLVKRLQQIEPGFRQVEQENKRRRAAVERPRGRRKATSD